MRGAVRSGWRLWQCGAVRGASQGAGDPSRGSPGQHQTPIVERLWALRGHHAEDALVQTAVGPKPPSASRTEITYGFASDAALRERYRNPWGAVRVGRLLEDLDALAGNVAHAHASDEDPSTRPLVLVTASVDRIRLDRPLALDADMTLSGEVVYVGSSSMEIRMKVLQHGVAVPAWWRERRDPSSPGEHAGAAEGPSLQADFAFVARDPVTGQAARVNPLAPETEGERATAAEVGARVAREKGARKALQRDPGAQLAQTERLRRWATPLLARAQAVTRGMPLARHGVSLEGRPVVLLHETETTNSFLCQSQQRNLGGRVFGGFIMRRAFELGFANCYAVCGARPRFVEVDQVDFHRPVEVGSLVRFTSRVLHVAVRPGGAGNGEALVEVVVSVLNPENRTLVDTNTIRLGFEVVAGIGGGGVFPEILPSSLDEAARIADALPTLIEAPPPPIQ